MLHIIGGRLLIVMKIRHINCLCKSKWTLIDIQTDFVNYLRPVINLKPGTKVSGTGTLLDPYHVITS